MDGSKKRKGPPASSGDNTPWRNKRVKVQRDARTLAAQTTSKAFKNGELDVASFVKAREFEITALEEGLARSKKALTQRAFQQVPKELRRRTASHNAKRVPKRLRRRAVREMVEDNTPTVTSRRRKLTRHMRLRVETAKRLRALGAAKKGKKGKKADGREGKENDAADKDKKTQAGVARSSTISTIDTRCSRVKQNTLSSAAVPPAKYRKRQLNKTWLPTHIFHAKRAHMTSPLEPLWQFAIPLTPTAKSYRPTHRASHDRGAIAWDTSYMSCISLEGNERSIQSLLRALGVGMGMGSDADAFWGRKGSRWRQGSRTCHVWLYERDHRPTKPIAPATLIWRAEISDSEPVAKRQLLIRVHPSAFHQLWQQVVRLCKVQKPQVVAHDMRFDIGSIEIVGPGSTEALVGALHPVPGQSIEPVWQQLAGLTNPALLPRNALLSFDVEDPRLHHPTRTPPPQDNPSALLELLAKWPLDNTTTVPGLFSHRRRQAATRALQTQKAINKRKALAGPGADPPARPTDPRIPIMLFTSPPSSTPTSSGTNSTQLTYTLLLPWTSVPPLFRSILYHPLSTGGQVRLSGLDQQRQVAFENGLPWFPADFPGTAAGDAWEAAESSKRKRSWEARPKGKRTQWDALQLGGPGRRRGEVGGAGWACDWLRLAETCATADGAAPAPFFHLPSPPSPLQPTQEATASQAAPATPLITVHLTLLSRGVPKPCARIYRLPSTDARQKTLWLASLKPHSTAAATTRAASHALALAQHHPRYMGSRRYQKKKRDVPPYARGATLAETRRSLAGDLVRAPPPPPPPHSPTATGNGGVGAEREGGEADDGDGVGEAGELCVPGEEDLVGFVTAGEFCLSEGRGAGVGSVVLARVEGARDRDREGRDLCIVRNAGETVGHLARWRRV